MESVKNIKEKGVVKGFFVKPPIKIVVIVSIAITFNIYFPCS
jgi:hypothetical protein